MVLLVANPSREEDDDSVRSSRTTRQRTPSAQSVRRLPPTTRLSFPPEVIQLVILHVTRPPDLANVASVSRYCNIVATPLLYASLSFGPSAFRRCTGHGRSRGTSGYVSTEFPLLRADAGAEDNYFDNRSSLCAETLARSPHLLAHARTLYTNLTVANYASAVRTSRGQRCSEDQPFYDWASLLSLPQVSNLRHIALGGVNDQHLRTLCSARSFKLTALELNLPPSALPELSCLATFFSRQRHITHFASRNLADIKGLQSIHVPRLTSIDVSAALAAQLAPGRPIATARIFPLATRRATGIHSADEILMAIHALAQSTNPDGVTALDISVLWFGDYRMGDDCRAFFAAIRDSLRGLRRLRITMWSDLTPSNVDMLFDCIMTTLPVLECLESFEIRTWAEYGINHPSHVPQSTRRALFDLWKEMCPSLVRVAAIERHTWVWHVSKRPASPTPPRPQPPIPPSRSNSDPSNILLIPGPRPLPPRPRPASGDWVRLSDRWDWKPSTSPLGQTYPEIITSPAPSTSSSGQPQRSPISRNVTPDVYPQVGGSWVRERTKQEDDSHKTWDSDLQIAGSTYQRNSLDEHYVRAAYSQNIQFAVRL
ncbi:hypothetical protein BDV93DRAFT_521065, partial [Ceratobasidium sp. AG-I]